MKTSITNKPVIRKRESDVKAQSHTQFWSLSCFNSYWQAKSEVPQIFAVPSADVVARRLRGRKRSSLMRKHHKPTSYLVRRDISIHSAYVRQNSFVEWDLFEQQNLSLTRFDNHPNWIKKNPIELCGEKWSMISTLLVRAAIIEASRLIEIDRIALGLFESIVYERIHERKGLFQKKIPTYFSCFSPPISHR